MSQVIDGFGDNFSHITRGSLLTEDLLHRIPSVLRAIKKLPASVRNHPDFDPWALITPSKSESLLLRGTADAENMETRAWIEASMNKAIRILNSKSFPRYAEVGIEWYKNLAKQSHDPRNILRVGSVLAEIGICLVINHNFPVSKVDGAAFLLVDGTPVIALSLRYSREDNFWFTLFHELAHVKFDLKIPEQQIIDDLDVDSQTDSEIFADDFAQQCFVSTQVWRDKGLRFMGRNATKELLSFATELSISPAILAGRLRRELNDYRLFREIIDRTDVRGLFE